MTKKPAHHVVSREGGWAVVKEGAKRASSFHPTKEAAVKQGRETSRNQGTELIVHNKDGRIGARDSHGGDPFPPKG